MQRKGKFLLIKEEKEDTYMNKIKVNDLQLLCGH